MKTILRVISYLRRYPLLGSAQLICATLMALSVVVFPSITGHVVDEILPEPARHHELLFEQRLNAIDQGLLQSEA